MRTYSKQKINFIFYFYFIKSSIWRKGGIICTKLTFLYRFSPSMPQSCKTPPKWQIFPPRRQPMPSRHDWRMRSYLPSAAASRTFSDRKLTNAYLKRRPLFRSQIFKFCCDIQGSHLIGCLWISLNIDQSECLICYSLCTKLTLLCTELTPFCTELPENCFYLNQSELSNFSFILLCLKSFLWFQIKLITSD